MLKALLAAIFLAIPAQAQRLSEEGMAVYKFCGMDTFHDSSQVDDCSSPDLRNVITEKGYLEKRPGNLRVATVASGFAVRALPEFIAPDGTRYTITHSSHSVYRTNYGASPVSLTTTSTSYEIDITAAYGKLIVANGFDNVWTWDGTSTSTLVGAPRCTYLGFADERVYCANTATSGSQVAVSSFGGSAYWTVPTTLTADAPTSFTFQRDDGENITCFKVTPWGKFVGKPTSTHIIKGYDNNTYYKRVIDPKIGCVDNRSVQMLDGRLIWLAKDGVYAWSGAGAPVLISVEIDPTIKAIRQLNSNRSFWFLTQPGDFSQGNLTASGAGAPLSTTILAGAITPSTGTFTDDSAVDFASGTMVNVSTHQIPGSIDQRITSGTIIGGDFTASSGHWTISNVGGSSVSAHVSDVSCPGPYFGSTGGDAFCARLCGGSFVAGQNAFVRVDVFDAVTQVRIASQVYTGAAGLNVIHPILFSNLTNGVTVTFSSGDNILFDPYLKNTIIAPGGFNLLFDLVTRRDIVLDCNEVGSADVGKIYIDNVRISSYQPTGTFTSRSFDTGVSTPIFGGASISMTSDTLRAITFQEQSSSDDSTWGSAVSFTPGNQPLQQKRYWRYIANYTTTSGTQTARIDSVGPLQSITSGYYNSPVRFIGSAITGFLAFDATEVTVDGGLITYYTRTATNSFTVNSATPAWQGQFNHTTIQSSVLTGSTLYYQWRALFNATSGTSTVQLLDANSQWQEGVSKPVASLAYDHRYYLSVMLSSTATNNDATLVWQKNQKWTKFAGPQYYSMGSYNNLPIAGTALTGSEIWRIVVEGLYGDDGDPIDAYWVSKDFTYQAPNQSKALNEIWVDATNDPNAASFGAAYSIDVGYSADKSSVFTSSTVAIAASASFVNAKVPMPAGWALGKYFRFKFSNSTADEYFRINGYTTYTEKQGRGNE